MGVMELVKDFWKSDSFENVSNGSAAIARVIENSDTNRISRLEKMVMNYPKNINRRNKVSEKKLKVPDEAKVIEGHQQKNIIKDNSKEDSERLN